MLARSARLVLAVASFGLLASVARAQALPLDLPRLMQRMAQRKSGQARFTEERRVSGLDGPLQASGMLSFAAPDRFTRQTLLPTRETMELQGRTLVIQRGTRRRQIEIDSVPEVGALLEALRGTLTGDAALLTRHFKVSVAGNDALWTLRLVPSDVRLAGQITQIELAGQNSDIRSIELVLAGGDRSLMLLEPLAPLP